MSSLKSIEKKYFQELLDLGTGYVLDFSNNTFASFFDDIVGIDIYDEKYTINGGSKANRLRAFWEIESDSVVGKILVGMLEHVKYQKLSKNISLEDPLYEECLKIANRLLGKDTYEVGNDERFSEKDFGNVSIGTLPFEPSLISILENRLEEAIRCHVANAPLAVILLVGSILEGILFGMALRYSEKFNRADNSPKDESRKVKPFVQWKLCHLIDVACELGYIKLDIKKFSHELRDFRNYIHPNQQATSKFHPDKHTAEICLQVLKAAVASLNGERK